MGVFVKVNVNLKQCYNFLECQKNLVSCSGKATRLLKILQFLLISKIISQILKACNVLKKL